MKQLKFDLSKSDKVWWITDDSRTFTTSLTKAWGSILNRVRKHHIGAHIIITIEIDEK